VSAGDSVDARSLVSEGLELMHALFVADGAGDAPRAAAELRRLHELIEKVPDLDRVFQADPYLTRERTEGWYLATLARYLIEAGSLQDAEAAIARARALLEKGSSVDRLVLAQPVVSLRLRQGRLEDALAEGKPGLEAVELPDPELHSEVSAFRRLLLRVAAVVGDRGLAARVLEELAAACEADPLSEPDLLVDVRVVQVAVLCEQGKWEAAEQVARTTVRLAEDKLGSDHLGTANARAWLGFLRLRQGDRQEAEKLLTSAEEVQARQLPADHPGLADTRGRLAEARSSAPPA
jgi:tetratricopeptide (TPR) repeat protein